MLFSQPQPQPPMQPLFTFITPTFGYRRRFLKRCIRSVMNQQTLDWEHLICNENEVPRTARFIEKITEKRINYYEIREKKGTLGHPQRDFLIKQSKGEWIAFLDDDNIILPYYTKCLENYLSDKFDLIIIKIKHSYYKMRPFPNHRDWGNPKSMRVGHIDSLNMVVRGVVAREIGWIERRRYGDDRFGARLAKFLDYQRILYVNKVLGLHL